MPQHLVVKDVPLMSVNRIGIVVSDFFTFTASWVMPARVPHSTWPLFVVTENFAGVAVGAVHA